MKFFAIFAVFFIVFATLATAALQNGGYDYLEQAEEYSDDGEMDQPELDFPFVQSFEKG